MADVDLCLGCNDRIKKLYRRDAELAYWFHLDPRTLSPIEKQGYLANLERCKAQQTIHLGNFNPVDWNGVYDLYMYAFGDEALAQKAKSQALELHVEQSCRKR